MPDSSIPTTSAILKGKLTMCTGPLDAVFSNLWSNSRPELMVPSFLVLLHQIMRASVPVMETAIRRCNEIGKDDPLTIPLIEYYAHHIVEERDHDVWTLEDLEGAGFDPAEVLAQIPPPAIARLAGAQHYWVEHHHPLMLLGCIKVLESFPPDSLTIDDMRDASGLPEVAFRTLRLHGELDPHHSAELDAFVDTLTLSRYHLGMIGISLMACMESLTECIQSLRPTDLERRATG